MIRRSNIQSDVFSYLWNRRTRKEGVRLKDIASHLTRSSDRIKNALYVLQELGIAIQIARGTYKVSDEVTK